MRVAIIPATTTTGEGRLSRYLINGLQAQNINLQILGHFALDRPNRKVFLGSLLLKRLLRDGSISIVHNLDNLGPFLLRHNDLDVKKVLTVHDIAPVILPHLHNQILLFDFKTILPKLIKNTDLTVVVSYSTMTDLTTRLGINEEKLSVIHLGVDRSIFCPKKDCRQVLNKHNLQHKYILYVGDDTPRKNLKNLVIAYSNICKEISQDLVLIGPINESKIRAYINSSNLPTDLKNEVRKRIIFLGYIAYEDLPYLYSAATALIFPSLYEGFGLPPLEAMACKTPVVLSNNSSLREVAEKAGLYIDDPLSCPEISRNILEIVNNETLRKSLQYRGYEQAKKFNWDKTIESTINMYSSLL